MRRFLMILSLALLSVLPVELFGQTTNWRDMYQVKKKDTIFGIAKKYGITIDELTAANPEMKTEGYKLKKGDYIFIPFTGQNAAKTAVSTPKNAGGNASGKSADIRTRAINVGIMLPLHNVDGDGERMTEYYRGLLLAFDELRSQGVSEIGRAHV